MSEHERHKIEYIVLASIMLLFLYLFLHFRYDRSMLKLLSGFVSVVYVFWGVIHHKLEGRYTKLILLEYFMYGTFVFLLLMTALSI
ncbi:hypothetical protein JXA34_00890 [Patescibacteria group bacterium]|nr:hypothetical protein [Patescibacteria group bacterium]